MTSHPLEAHGPTAPGVIEVRIHSVNQLFNSMDPTPFPDKDLDHEAEQFIVGWAMEHPSHAPLELRVHLNDPGDPGEDLPMGESIRHYFAYRRDVTSRRFHQTLARGRLTLLIGLLFLTACLGAADLTTRIGTGPIFQIGRESFIIAGWVAMWKPMEIFLYDWWPLRHERNIYDRLSRAQVHLIHPA